MSTAARNTSENKTVRSETDFIPYEEVVKWAKNPPVLKPDISAVGWTLGAAVCVVFLWYYFVYRPSLPPREKKADEETEEEEAGPSQTTESETDSQGI